MELQAPGYGLVAWTLFCFVTLCLIGYAFVKLIRNDDLTSNARLKWALVILFVPVLGAILYLSTFRMRNAKTRA